MTRQKIFLTVLAILVMNACKVAEVATTKASAVGEFSPEAEGIVTDLGPTLAKNQSAAPRVVEVTLEVKEQLVDLGGGLRTLAMTYNGVLPGPLIVANVGDELVIHVKNSLKVPTILHPHGFVLPHEYDGSPLSQDPIAPGSSFTHRFKLRHAGTYWYHSHYHGNKDFVVLQLETENKQLGRGLYGAIVVRDPEQPKMREKVLVVSNATLTGGPVNTLAFTEKHIYIVNGKTSQATTIRPGESQRLRIINATVDAALVVGLSNGSSMTLIGTDSSLTDKPFLIKKIRLDAGERADVVVQGPTDGSKTIELIADPIQLIPRPQQGADNDNPMAKDFWYKFEPIFDPPQPTSLVTFHIRGEPTTPVRIPDKLGQIELPKKFDAVRKFTIGTQYFAFTGPEAQKLVDEKKLDLPMYFRFPVNGGLYPQTPKPEEKIGSWVIHQWKNDSPSPHPIHLHGFRFVVLKRNGIDVPIRSWKDTAEVTPYGTLEYAVHFDGYPGEWMYHCHFESHMEGGFMGTIIVKDASGYYPPSKKHHHN